MGHTIILNEKIILDALKEENLNYFTSTKTCLQTLHFLIYEQIKKQIIDSGIEVKDEYPKGKTCNKTSTYDVKPMALGYDGKTIDSKYCCSYGHDDYSIEALNYLNEKLDIPTLNNFLGTNEKYINFGNYKFIIGNTDEDIEIKTIGNLNLVGYSCDVRKNKRKTYVSLLGLWFTKRHFKVFDLDALNSNFEKKYLQEIKLDGLGFPIMYAHKLTGQLYACSCFESGIKKTGFSIDPIYGNKFTARSLEKLKYVNNLCNYCSGGVPHLDYAGKQKSVFLQKYYPYFHMLFLEKYNCAPYELHRDKGKLTEVENELREHFDYPKIGERWISETTLYKIVKYLFSEEEVVFHYRGKEMEGLELDIWVPHIKVGIEYQGEQHYHAIKHWGGEEGLKKRISNDKKKKKLCKAQNYTLIEVKYSENITEQLIINKLKGFL